MQLSASIGSSYGANQQAGYSCVGCRPTRRYLQMSAQITQKDDKAEFAVIPIEEYNRLLAMAVDFDDLVAYDKAIAELESGEDEAIPAEIVARLVAGDEHPLKVWCEFRGLTQSGLAHQVGVSHAQLALIEGGKRQGTVDVLKGLVRVLNVDLEDLV